MSAPLTIVADSTCDLSPELVAEYGISILPLNVILDEKAYRDGAEISPDEIYTWSDAHNATPKTSAPLMEDAANLLRPLAGGPVLCFGISEQMSSSCQVMRLAAEDAGCTNCRVVDSRSLSTGVGMQVVRAAELARQGLALDEIEAQILAARDKVRASFVVDTLTFLQRGGRCGAVTALLGNALHLKPKITVADGKMGVSKKYRGAQNKVIADYVADLRPALEAADPRHVFITHSGVSEEVLQQVTDFLQSLHHFERIHITRAGGVISSHCGPGTLGVLFYES